MAYVFFTFSTILIIKVEKSNVSRRIRISLDKVPYVLSI